jgi:hypothetical protein
MLLTAESATPLLHAVGHPVETVSVRAYCHQSHGQISQQREVSHKALHCRQ